jgi:hypothetical protein
MKQFDESNWYRNQSWLVRRWRDRYLFLVPFEAIRDWKFRQTSWSDNFAHCWSVARGMCDFRRINLMHSSEME